MNRFELAVWWISSWAFVLIVANLIISKYERYIDGKKVAVKGVQPQVEVYEKNYKKINNVSKFDRAG